MSNITGEGSRVDSQESGLEHHRKGLGSDGQRAGRERKSPLSDFRSGVGKGGEQVERAAIPVEVFLEPGGFNASPATKSSTRDVPPQAAEDTRMWKVSAIL